MKLDPKTISVICDLIGAAKAGMNWMEQVDRAKIGSATRGILHVDMGITSTAIHKANRFLDGINEK